MRSLVTVVILDLDGKRFLQSLLLSLEQQSYSDFGVIVVENGDAVRVDAGKFAFPILIVRPRANLGFAGGVNMGYLASAESFIVFLNNDTVVGPDWLAALVERLEGDETIGAVNSKVVFFRRYVEVELRSESRVGGRADARKLGLCLHLDEGYSLPCCFRSGFHLRESDGVRDWIWTDGDAVLWAPIEDDGCVRLKLSGHPDLVGTGYEVRAGGRGVRASLEAEDFEVRLEDLEEHSFDVINNAGCEIGEDWAISERGIFERDGEEFNEPVELEAASGCSLMIRRSALEGELPFDPEFFAYFEDSDLSFRLRKAGYKVVYEPRSVVRHHRSGTSGIQSPLNVFYGARNRFWVIAKHAALKVVWKAVSKEMWELGKYRRYLNDEFSLSRLYWSTWYGFVRRFLIRILDLE